jgi:hypothetical protein
MLRRSSSSPGKSSDESETSMMATQDLYSEKARAQTPTISERPETISRALGNSIHTCIPRTSRTIVRPI